MSRWPSGSGGPTFLVIGAAKAGTTSIHHHLSHHPEVFVTQQKETNFFAFGGSPPNYSGPGDSAVNTWSITNVDEYIAAYEGGARFAARGEVCPSYLYFPEAPARIAEMLPDVRLVAVLRNPADRAFSNYLHLRFQGREPLADFEEALAQEESRRDAGWEWFWRYADIGAYGRQLAGYLAHFSREQLLVVMFEDFQRSPETVIKAIYGHIGVDPSVPIDATVQWRRAAPPRNRLIAAGLNRPNPVKTVAKLVVPSALRSRALAGLTQLNSSPQGPPKMTLVARQRLLGALELDTHRAERLTGLDLSGWGASLRSPEKAVR